MKSNQPRETLKRMYIMALFTRVICGISVFHSKKVMGKGENHKYIQRNIIHPKIRMKYVI